VHIHMKHAKSKFSSLFEKSPLDLDKKCVKIKTFFKFLNVICFELQFQHVSKTGNATFALQ